MDKEILEYRKKHKKCKWRKYHPISAISSEGYYECLLKDKDLSCFDLVQTIIAIFCKYYKTKEENE